MFKAQKFEHFKLLAHRPTLTNHDKFKVALKQLHDILTNSEAETKSIYFYGDFNFPKINWNTKEVPESLQFFIDFCDEWNLELVITRVVF